MKTYLIGQYLPYLVIGVYGLDIQIPDKLIEESIEPQVNTKCEEWFEKLKTDFEAKFNEKINIPETVSYVFRKFSYRDLIEFPYTLSIDLGITTELNQAASNSRVIEFNALVEVQEEAEMEFLDYILEKEFYYKQTTEEEVASFYITD